MGSGSVDAVEIPVRLVVQAQVFSRFDLAHRKDIEKPQLFYLNTDTVVKEDFRLF